jgi:hypothetical protein
MRGSPSRTSRVASNADFDNRGGEDTLDTFDMGAAYLGGKVTSSSKRRFGV